ncbi:MAG: entericidin [Pseudomonadota bacterium]
MKKLLVLAVLVALSACNTISGVGQDISGGANKVAGWMGG